MIKSLKDLLDKFSRFTNSLVYDGGICKRLQYKTNYKILQEKIVPIKQKIQKVLEEFVGFDKESLKENLNSLNELIDYEMKASEQLEKYFENYSELIYYSNKGVK